MRDLVKDPTRTKRLILSVILGFFFSFQSYAQSQESTAPLPPRPPVNVTVQDLPNDRGGATIIGWELSPDDDGIGKVTGYLVTRSESASGPFETVGDATRGTLEFSDNQTDDSKEYYYKVDAFFEALDAAGQNVRIISAAVPVGPVKSYG
ncbi:MAG: hypothetical protein ACREBV_00020, partial [Candidatus Zixiibacteriota bacterium]